MKVSIMSMQRIINYGSFLQAYGLKKTIESLGHTVEFADYEVGAAIVSAPASQNGKSRLKRVLSVVFSKEYRERRSKEIRQNQAFNTFYDMFKSQWLPLLGVTDEMNYTPEADVLVIGSDEVFNCTQPGTDVGYSLQLFGRDNKARRLISYAASFGSTTEEKLREYGKTEEIAACLNNFYALSVRDKNSCEIVKNLTGKEPVSSIDPVLLYSFQDEIRDIKTELKDYVVVYAYSGRISDSEAEVIQAFAHKQGKKTLSIGVMQDFCDMYINADPFTLLAYIKNADYVVTDTFHGTVFSLKFGVPFAVIIRESNRQKLCDLLNKFDCAHRQVKDIKDLEPVITGELDTAKIAQRLAKYQEEATEYLKANIE